MCVTLLNLKLPKIGYDSLYVIDSFVPSQYLAHNTYLVNICQPNENVSFAEWVAGYFKMISITGFIPNRSFHKLLLIIM